ncbi:DNA/RNA nuclease SfsA [Paraglaciecola arctica]|uniref:Sugar fermentation stimulation protein homolog n=1 Tax=Paraglaciecola arctica BSs20135 TaxID=493475 RepID=K6Z6N0_9ALTE|nr:DNA/RNA nuclease SfsA [Paraglaciecola arctica]GAC19105.1 sugar fermentation stimulation protein A [Paraglaciecola arctica BSs20135]
MQFSSTLIQGTLIKRYKRFLADVELADGSIVIAHCPNTGAMTGCAEPGWKVWLSPSNNPKRKLLYTWEVVLTDQHHWIGINTHKANVLVKEAIQENRIAELVGYQTLKAEVKFGEENSRIDFLLTDHKKADCYIEVKSVTLLDDKAGYFPDAKTLRGQKHLRELSIIASQGKRAVLFFCVQHSGIQSVQVAKHIDPDYAMELKQAMLNGVQILCYGCEISSEKIYINQPLQFFS